MMINLNCVSFLGRKPHSDNCGTRQFGNCDSGFPGMEDDTFGKIVYDEVDWEQISSVLSFDVIDSKSPEDANKSIKKLVKTIFPVENRPNYDDDEVLMVCGSVLHRSKSEDTKGKNEILDYMTALISKDYLYNRKYKMDVFVGILGEVQVKEGTSAIKVCQSLINCIEKLDEKDQEKASKKLSKKFNNVIKSNTNDDVIQNAETAIEELSKVCK